MNKKIIENGTCSVENKFGKNMDCNLDFFSFYR